MVGLPVCLRVKATEMLWKHLTEVVFVRCLQHPSVMAVLYKEWAEIPSKWCAGLINSFCHIRVIIADIESEDSHTLTTYRYVMEDSFPHHKKSDHVYQVFLLTGENLKMFTPCSCRNKEKGSLTFKHHSVHSALSFRNPPLFLMSAVPNS